MLIVYVSNLQNIQQTLQTLLNTSPLVVPQWLRVWLTSGEQRSCSLNIEKQKVKQGPETINTVMNIQQKPKKSEARGLLTNMSAADRSTEYKGNLWILSVRWHQNNTRTTAEQQQNNIRTTSEQQQNTTRTTPEQQQNNIISGSDGEIKVRAGGH